MTPEQLQYWIFHVILVTGGLAFVSCFVLLALQPRRVVKWFTFCFGWVFACFGSLFLLGAWQAAARVGPANERAWQVPVGGGLWLVGFVIAAAGWLIDRKPSAESLEQPSDDATRIFENHARLINGCCLTGAVLTVVTVIAILKGYGGEGIRTWTIPALALGFQVPALLFAVVFPPRCGGCGKGRMKIVGLQPARYRCSRCGSARETHIDIGNRRRF